MKIKILGSGTSTGVPEIGCTCPVCTSNNPYDKRLRTSALIQTDDVTLLMDCGPDFREQMLHTPFGKIDAVLTTHEHYDHVGGLDDLRPFCRFGKVPIYAEGYTVDALRLRMPYCFAEKKYPGVPDIALFEIAVNQPFRVNQTEIIPFRVMHGRLPILGYRIDNMAYITDMLTMPDESFDLLKDLDVLILKALRLETHISHQTLEEALHTAERIGAAKTYLIHMSHHIGLHADIDKILPKNVSLTYDGLEIVSN